MGDHTDAATARPDLAARSLAIEARGLVKTYGETRALDGLDLVAETGGILGVLGPNGAGKTTAVRVLTTLSVADAGVARVAGHDVQADAAPGMVFRSAEAAQQLGFVVFLPLGFVSNAFVPTSGMPSWLQTVANWNPVSAVAASCRNLFGNPNPASSIGAWPMQHPELYALLWALGVLAVFGPLAVHLYHRKSAS